MTDSGQTAPEGTRAALLQAGLHLFGTRGFAASSTREIAAAAKTNVASIAYHFGGKEGLRTACAGEVARRILSVIGMPGPLPEMTPEAAAQRLEAMLRGMVAFIAGSSESASVVAFVLREVGEEGNGLNSLYSSLIEPKHRELCALWSAATGQPAESERTRLNVFAVIGQVLYFRIAGPVIRRRMGWTAQDARAVTAIADTLAGNLHALIEKERRA